MLCRVHSFGHDVFIKGMIPIINCGIFRQPMTEKLVEQAAVFVKKGLTGYDACYAALARDINGTWITFDEKAHKRLAKEKVSHNLNVQMPKTWE